MLITERYKEKIYGVISCYDRIVIQGVIPGWCFAHGMTSYLYANDIRIFDYPRFAEPLNEEIRENAERIAKENGLQIEFIRSQVHFEKMTVSRRSSQNEESNLGSYIYSQQWKPVIHINPGMIKQVGKLF